MEIRPILSSLLRSKTGAVLIAAQIALTLAIISNALYIVKDRLDRSKRPSGIDEANTFYLTFGGEAGAEAEAVQMRDVEVLRAIPGVASAAWTNQFPMAQSGWNLGLTTRPDDPSSGIGAATYFTPDGVVAAYGARLVEGRDFTAEDVRRVDPEAGQLGADVVILTRQLATRLFPDAPSVVGKTVHLGSGNGGQPMRVVGVIDRLISPFAQADDTAAYSGFVLPVRHLVGQASYIVRTEPGQRARVMRDAEEALAKLRDDRMLLFNDTADGRRAQRYQAETSVAGMLLAVTIGLLLVTGSGIVGLASLWVTQRRKQIGVRRALGARRFDILRYFLVENAMISTVGIVLGVALALGLNQLLVSKLELPRLPLEYLGFGMLTLWGLGILAVYGPAWRASAVPPAIATRSA